MIRSNPKMQNSTAIRTRTRPRAASPAREIPWSFLLLVIICASVVAAGFFFAARQHFTSMDYGIKNSKLREQLESLEAEKRRLLLAREIALSPLSVRKAAREIGLREVTADDAAVIAVAAKKPVENDAAPPAEPAKANAALKKSEAARVVPTVISAPVKQKQDGETRRRVVDTQKDKKEKVEVALLKLK